MSPKIPHVLVVEDDADTFEWVRRRLARYGFEVAWAVTVSDGLLKLDAGPCAVILDLGMPDGSGTSILRAIRDRNLPIKVAVVSGDEGSAMHVEAARLQPDAFFLKPVDAIELTAWLKSVCP
jgi:DNA-binding response OmpR family regulator